MTSISLTRQQSREVDAVAIDRYGFTGLVLMENAGRGVVDVLLDVDQRLVGKSERWVLILCGKGNNGGDGFVIARHLQIRGVSVRVCLLVSPAELQGDALANYEILSRAKLPIVDLSSTADLAAALNAEVSGAGWIIDAMLGTGAEGEPREPIAEAIGWMNAQPAQRLAIDVPSGLDCDSGLAAAKTVRADHTCTFVAPKVGFLLPGANEYVGQLHVVSIGIPPQVLSEVVEEA